MSDVLISLGANLGEPVRTLDAALRALTEHPRVKGLVASGFHATEPIGGPAGQPAFVNAAARFQTDLAPEELLDLLQAIETAHGRRRQQRWEARTLDLDLLLYDLRTLETERLTLPHPRLAFRRFMLAPAVEIAGDMVHPDSEQTLLKLLEYLDTSPRYVALSGVCWFAKTYVAGAAVERLAASGVPACVSRTRGITVFGQPPTDDREHPFHEHFMDLLPRLREDLQAALDDRAAPWLVSSFWPGEIELGAKLWFAGAAQEAALEAVSEAFSTLPRPRLVVHLHTPDDLLLLNPDLPGRENGYYEQARRLAEQRDALDRFVASYRDSPRLRLSAAAPETALEEVAAAVQAMI